MFKNNNLQKITPNATSAMGVMQLTKTTIKQTIN